MVYTSTGSQHFRRTKLPEFWLILPWQSSKIPWEIFSRGLWEVKRWFYHRQLLLSGEVCNIHTAWTLRSHHNQSVNGHKLDTHHTDETFPFWVTVKLPEFYLNFVVPSFQWLEKWKLIFKVSLISRVSRNSTDGLIFYSDDLHILLRWPTYSTDDLHTLLWWPTYSDSTLMAYIF